MIHLNHAGTSWPKPAEVRRAAAAALELDPRASATQAVRDHAAVEAGLGLEAGRLRLTPGCTAALGLAIADLGWALGNRCLFAELCHVALERPVSGLRRRGVEVVAIPPVLAKSQWAPIDLERLQSELAKGARAVVIPSADNVTGALFPVDEVADLARSNGALLVVDAAQTAGWLPLPTESADLVAFGGHKGLLAPWGIGGVWSAPEVALSGPRHRGTASTGWCDAGSLDRSALAGLRAGLELLERWGTAATRLERGRARIRAIEEVLLTVPGGLRLGPSDLEARLPTVALAVPDPAAAAADLERAGLGVSAGLQCAGLAHAALGTGERGALRFSVGADPDQAVQPAVDRIEAWAAGCREDEVGGGFRP